MYIYKFDIFRFYCINKSKFCCWINTSLRLQLTHIMEYFSQLALSKTDRLVSGLRKFRSEVCFPPARNCVFNCGWVHKRSPALHYLRITTLGDQPTVRCSFPGALHPCPVRSISFGKRWRRCYGDVRRHDGGVEVPLTATALQSKVGWPVAMRHPLIEFTTPD